VKRLRLFIIVIILLISGCHSFYDLTIRPAVDFSFLFFYNSMIIDIYAKYITCYYFQQNKFPESHSNILPFFIANSSDDISIRDATILMRDTSYTGLARYNFKLKKYTKATFNEDSTDSNIDSIRTFKCTGTLTFVDSIVHKKEKAYTVEIKITSINGVVYWNNDSTYIDDYSSSHFLNSSENDNFFRDTIQISRSCQKGYGLEINSKHQ
jgi:hypothetical protein